MGLTVQRHYRMLLYTGTLAIVVLGAAVAGWGVFLLFPANLGQGYHSSLAAVQAIRKVLFWRVAGFYGLILLFIAVAVAALHVLYSHRVAGPTYRFGCEAQKIARGNLSCAITLRRKDALVDMGDLLNDVGCRYGGRVRVLQDFLAVLEARSREVPGLIARGDEVALRHASEEIAAAVEGIERSLAEVRT